jgi:tetratricopeptide (TPR) repeat protein
MRQSIFRGAALALAVAVVLAGCAGGGRQATHEEPPYIPGSGYHLMMAEIAIQRGSYGTAAEEYLNAAERSDDPELSQRAAEFAFDYGFDGIALRAARRWAGLEPDNTSVHLYLARLYLRRNDLRLALQETERALEPPDQRNDEDYLLLIRELGQESNAAGVTRLLTRLAARSSESPGLQLALAMSALGSGDFDLALESAHAGVSEETAAEASQLIARALMARGDANEAMDYLARQIEANPTLQLQLERARVLAAAEKHAEALEELGELATRYPDEPEITRLRGLVSLDAGDTETAWENFTALLTSGQGTYESLFYMAEIAEKAQRYDQALRFYGRIGEGPFLIPAQAAIARLAERSGDPQSALQRLDQFVRDHPRYAADAWQLRAGLLERLGRHEEALETLDDALGGRPDDEALLLGRGALLERSGRLEDALADMRAAVAVAPDSAAALNALGYTLANRTREHDEAYRLVRRALEIEPDSAAILDSLGWVLYRQKRWPEARTYLSLAHSRFPDPEVAAHLGEVMWKQGERDAAMRLWEDALEKSPESAPLKETIARFRQ